MLLVCVTYVRLEADVDAVADLVTQHGEDTLPGNLEDEERHVSATMLTSYAILG